MRINTLIVGQGLAGSLLARRLAETGSVCVVDPAESNASQVAAGLMTPLTGRKFRLTSEYPRLFARALEVYGPLGVLNRVTVYRMFVDAEQQSAGTTRAHDPDCAPFVDKLVAGPGQLDADLADTYGGVLMHGAWVDLPRLLEDTRLWLATRFVRDRVLAHEVEDVGDGVQWKGIHAERIIWCDGWRAMLPGGLWSDVPWQPAKGEALDLLSSATSKPFVLNREGWALPLGGGRWRTGTNWDWTVQDEVPTETQRDKLLVRFRSYFTDDPSAQTIKHVAGVRPCTRDNRPCVGQHADRTRHFLLNGLGPRGTVWAPTAIDALVDFLNRGTPIPAEIDVSRLVNPESA